MVLSGNLITINGLMCKDRRYVHSFWTLPCRGDKNKLGKYLTYFVTSLAFIKKSGLPIVLHTDSFGKEVFKKFPYDEIYTTLDNIPEDINPKFFAYGKFLAMKKENLGSVHIDGDVLIENEELAKKILNFKSDLITQSIEEGRTIKRFYRRWDFDGCKDIVNKYLPFEDFDFAYNCGTVGINNQELKDRYINDYLNLVNELKDYNFESKFAIPDLVCEQMLLYHLNNSSEIILGQEIVKDMRRLGYTHIMGPNKMNDDILSLIKSKLLSINIDIYNKLCQEI